MNTATCATSNQPQTVVPSAKAGAWLIDELLPRVGVVFVTGDLRHALLVGADLADTLDAECCDHTWGGRRKYRHPRVLRIGERAAWICEAPHETPPGWLKATTDDKFTELLEYLESVDDIGLIVVEGIMGLAGDAPKRTGTHVEREKAVARMELLAQRLQCCVAVIAPTHSWVDEINEPRAIASTTMLVRPETDGQGGSVDVTRNGAAAATFRYTLATPVEGFEDCIDDVWEVPANG